MIMKATTLTLKKLGEEVRTEILEAMIEAIEYGYTTACVTIDTDAGYLDVCTNDYDEKECVVCHDDNEHESPNLERWAEDIIPDWSDVVDEVDRRNGRDEDDVDYSGLDPAFSSWEEVNAMFFRRY